MKENTVATDALARIPEVQDAPTRQQSKIAEQAAGIAAKIVAINKKDLKREVRIWQGIEPEVRADLEAKGYHLRDVISNTTKNVVATYITWGEDHGKE